MPSIRRFLLRERVRHSYIFCIDRIWRKDGSWNAGKVLTWLEGPADREVRHGNSGPVNDTIGWSRAGIGDCEECNGPFGRRAYFGSSGLIAWKRQDWIGHIDDGTFIKIDESPHLLPSGTLLSIAYRNQEAGENSQKERENGNDSVGDLTFAYKLFTPFGLFVWAWACAVASRSLYVRTESRIVENIAFLIGLSGPVGAFFGLWWWVLN